ncbi:MAG: 30S ribosomal protein S8 [Candidatus Andersenbacteria bacterium]|nr:30S ribosomal protein S8 [Candidatus Andersenbacteria bacterium]MBI3251054.1 30S ribosomal protein S8 [Candidatus Andersenbacteria bacterium]
MDPIADMLTSLINAQRAQKKRVAVPYSRFKEALLATLQEQGFVSSVRTQDSPAAKLIVSLAYTEDGSPRLNGVKRLSTPGRRRYAGATQMPYNYTGFGKIIVSTSKGLMEADKAKKEKLGGELVCAIW